MTRNRVSRSIPINNDSGSTIGFLVNLASDDVENLELMTAISSWRNKSKKFFLSQFEATPARTRSWLEHDVIPATDRQIFLVYTNEELLIGHIGYKSLRDGSAELDNFVRGEPGGDPRLIYFAERTLLEWLHKERGVMHFEARVQSHNFLALQLHQSLGFRVKLRLPLNQQRGSSETHLIEGPPGEPSSINLFHIVLELTYDEIGE
jgi:hypothetical protein